MADVHLELDSDHAALVTKAIGHAIAAIPMTIRKWAEVTVCEEPHLGLAETGALLAELAARFDVHGPKELVHEVRAIANCLECDQLAYRTVDT